MPFTCNSCGLTKPNRFFSPCMYRKDVRKCRDCGRAENRARLEARAAGLRRCADCGVAKDLSQFTKDRDSVSCYCSTCYARRQRERNARIRESATHLTCKRCNVEKPRSEFSPSGRANGLDYRCKECNARRTAMGRMTDTTKFGQAAGAAKRRGLPFTLTMDEYLAIRAKPCHYCGFPVPPTGLAMDRLDNSGGYTPDNVVPCCWPCNQARNTVFTPEEMLLLGQVVACIKAERVAKGLPLDAIEGWGRPRKYDYA